MSVLRASKTSALSLSLSLCLVTRRCSQTADRWPGRPGQPPVLSFDAKCTVVTVHHEALRWDEDATT